MSDQVAGDVPGSTVTVWQTFRPTPTNQGIPIEVVRAALGSLGAPHAFLTGATMSPLVDLAAGLSLCYGLGLSAPRVPFGTIVISSGKPSAATVAKTSVLALPSLLSREV